MQKRKCSGAHTWQRDCAHARLVTRDGEIEITVSVTRTYVRSYELRAGCTTRWARSRSPNYTPITVLIEMPDLDYSKLYLMQDEIQCICGDHKVFTIIYIRLKN